MTTHTQDITQRLYEFIIPHMRGGCKVLSLGDECPCPLCDIDRLNDLIVSQDLIASQPCAACTEIGSLFIENPRGLYILINQIETPHTCNVTSGTLPETQKIFAVERDRIWCKALLVLDTRDMQKVLEEFNKLRMD